MTPTTRRGPAPTVWQIEPHTRAKHDLVRKYLGGWFPILGRYNKRILFLDGFAGPGIYAGGEDGSPVIALRTLLDHSAFAAMARTEFVFLFLEPEADRAESLEARLGGFVSERGGLPRNVTYDIRQSTFTDAAENIIAALEEQQHELAPTFAFIDPFGFSGVPIATIARLLAFDKCEVFFNLMFDFVNRFAMAGNVDHHLRDVFGCDAYLQAGDYTDAQARRAFLLGLYEQQLNAVGGFKYVQRFDMFNAGGHNVYSLFFGTRDLTGVKVMKDAMWKVDPGNGNGFSDRLDGQQVLFQETPDFAPLRASLLAQFAGKEVSVEEVEEFTLVHTPYGASHYKKPVLIPLEKDGVISVTSIRPKRFTFPPGTTIKFPD